MQPCEFLEKCPIWQRFNADVKLVWINAYCKGPKQGRCARRKLARNGRPVPENLLPNAATLD